MSADTRPERAAPSNTVSAPVEGLEGPQAPVEILIVDDRPENLLALEAILEPLGQTIVRAGSGDEALRKLLSHNVAMILLDVQMPGINGFETARLIKSRERTKYIPIIFLTAISKDEEYVFEGYSVGAVDYMAKPSSRTSFARRSTSSSTCTRSSATRTRSRRCSPRGERRELELRHTNEIYESEARFSEIVGSAMDAIIAFDRTDASRSSTRARSGCSARRPKRR
jgi:CheY-like chemotaxis protein